MAFLKKDSDSLSKGAGTAAEKFSVQPANNPSNFGGWSWTYSKKVTGPPKETGRSYRDAIQPTNGEGEGHTSKRPEVPPQRREEKRGKQTNQIGGN